MSDLRDPLPKDRWRHAAGRGRVIDPLRTGAASLVIYADGSVDIGAWGGNVRMTPQVVSVRQNLLPLVVGGRPTPRTCAPGWSAECS